MTESQLICVDFREHTTGNLSLALEEKVHLKDFQVLLKGHVSVIVMLPSNWKEKSLNRVSANGEEVALTDL